MKHYRWLTAMLALLAVVVMVPTVTATPQRQTFSASLTPVGGLVQYLPAGKTDWTTINQVTLVNAGDQIRTGEKGLAKLNLVTGTQLDMFPTSQLEINTLSMGSGDNGGLNFVATQLLGTVVTNVSQTVKDNDIIRLNTPAFAVNIRGSKLTSTVSASGKSMVRVDESTKQEEFIFTKPDGTVQVVKLGPGGIVFGEQKPGEANPTICGTASDLECPLNPAELKTFFQEVLAENPGAASVLQPLLDVLDKPDVTAADLQAAIETGLQNLSTEGTLAPICDPNSTDPACQITPPSTCGNQTCDVEGGESIVTCAVDCEPLITNLVEQVNNLPVATQEPGQASGVGKLVCVVTTTADVYLKGVNDAKNLAVVPSGTSLTAVGRTNSGYVVNFNGQQGVVASSVVSASGGCR